MVLVFVAPKNINDDIERTVGLLKGSCPLPKATESSKKMNKYDESVLNRDTVFSVLVEHPCPLIVSLREAVNIQMHSDLVDHTRNK